MKIYLPVGVILAIFCLLGAASQAPTEKEKRLAIEKETKLLEGEWKLIGSEARGEKSSEDPNELRGERMVFKGSKVMFHRDEEESDYTVDPSSSPKKMDAITSRKTKRELIYELKDDTLKLCFSEGSARPKEFKTGAERKEVILIFKRVLQ